MCFDHSRRGKFALRTRLREDTKRIDTVIIVPQVKNSFPSNELSQVGNAASSKKDTKIPTTINAH